MTAKNLYKELKRQANEVTDVDNSVLFVSDTVSKYMRNEIKKMVKRSFEMICTDYELGIITSEQATKEVKIENLILKSL